MKPMPAKPSIIIAQVEGSGTAVITGDPTAIVPKVEPSSYVRVPSWPNSRPTNAVSDIRPFELRFVRAPVGEKASENIELKLCGGTKALFSMNVREPLASPSVAVKFTKSAFDEDIVVDGTVFKVRTPE